MTKTSPTSTEIRYWILKVHKNVWEKNSDPQGYLGLEEIIPEIQEKVSISKDHIASNVNSLKEDGYLDIRQVSNPHNQDEVLARITGKGREYIEDYNYKKRTTKLLCCSIAISIIGLLINIITGIN